MDKSVKRLGLWSGLFFCPENRIICRIFLAPTPTGCIFTTQLKNKASMQISGKITQALPVVSGTKKDGGTWSKQSFVITEETDKYPKSLCFEVWNDKVPVSLGETCTIHFETKASEYNGKWYNEIRCWKKEGATSAPAAPSAPASAPAPAPSAPPATGGKLTMNEATFQKAKAAVIAIEGDDAKRAKFDEIKAKYELTFEQNSAIEALINDLPF